MRKLLTNRAVTLTELLVVLGLISMLASVSLPAVTSLMQGKDFSRRLYQLSGTLEEARRMAMAQNTFVWLGLSERKVNGRPAVVLTALVSLSGQASDLQTGNTRPLMRPLTLENMSLDPQAYGRQAGADVANSTGIEESDYSFTLKLPGETTATAFKALEFKPNGEVGLSANALRYVSLGVAGGPEQAVDRPTAGIQLSRLSGNALVLRQ